MSLRHPQLGETYLRARQGPVPPQGMGEVPRPREALRPIGCAVCVNQTDRSGWKLSREAPQGQLNLAYPTGIRAEALSLWLKGPLPGRGVNTGDVRGRAYSLVAALPPVYTGVPPQKADFGPPKMRPELIAG